MPNPFTPEELVDAMLAVYSQDKEDIPYEEYKRQMQIAKDVIKDNQ